MWLQNVLNSHFLVLILKRNRILAIFKQLTIVNYLQCQWTMSVRGELFGHRSCITSLNVSDNFHVLVSTGRDKEVFLWDTNR